MGRRNYDLTGITPGSPGWKVQQERKHWRAGLPGPAPVQEHPSTPTGRQSDLPVDEKQTPRALVTVPEEEADDMTPTVGNFPASAGHLQGQHVMSKEPSESPSSADLVPASQRRSSGIKRSDNDLMAQVPVQEPQDSVTSEDTLATPKSHPENQAVGLQWDSALADNRDTAPPGDSPMSAWQPMTMEDFHIGNIVLQGLAAQGIVEASASCFENGQHAIMSSNRIYDSREDAVMGES